jgi:DNA-directed RNA polymerase I, II, and III subunit RPABC2
MSDLEQPNIENMSVAEPTMIETMTDDAPTFPTSNSEKEIAKQKAILSMNVGDLDDNIVKDEDDNGEDMDGSDDEDYEDVNDDDDDDDDSDDDSVVNSIDGVVDDDDVTVSNNNISSNKKKSTNRTVKSNSNNELQSSTIDIPIDFEKTDSDYDSDDDDEEDDEYLQKFDKEMRENYILEQHPESVNHNYDEIYQLASVQRNKENIIIDDLHKTIPILTKYEKTRILGLRAKQLNNGAKPMVKMNVPIIDGYLIALKELEEKAIPVIIRRPIPNGSSEYWHLKDLEILQ